MAKAVIPKRFERIWFGPRPLPHVYRDYGQTWIDHHPGWHMVTRDAFMWEFVNQEAFDTLRTHVPPHGGAKPDTIVQVQKADIASYEVLWERGGVYLNCDLECRKSIGSLLDGVTCAVAWEVDDTYPSNAFMAATPKHPFLACVLDLLPKRMEQFSHQPINEQTGPHLLKQALDVYDGDDVLMLRSALFMPFSFNNMDRAGDEFPEAYAVHHWGHRTPDEELWGD